MLFRSAPVAEPKKVEQKAPAKTDIDERAVRALESRIGHEEQKAGFGTTPAEPEAKTKAIAKTTPGKKTKPADENTEIFRSKAPKQCPAKFNEVNKIIAEMKSCWVDSDCVAVHFGCPWQDAGCDYSIVGTEDKDKVDVLTKAMAAYDVECVDKTEGFRVACGMQDEQYLNLNCGAPQLKCMNGVCMTLTGVLIHDQLDQ